MTGTETISKLSATYNFSVTVNQCPSIDSVSIDSMTTTFIAYESGDNTP